MGTGRVLHVKTLQVHVRELPRLGPWAQVQTFVSGYVWVRVWVRVLEVCKVEPFTAVIGKPGYRFVHEGRLCRIIF